MSRCPTRDDLILFVDGALPSAEGDDVAHHLDQCADCRASRHALDDLDALLAESEPLPEGLIERLQVIPDAHPQRPRCVASWRTGGGGCDPARRGRGRARVEQSAATRPRRRARRPWVTPRPWISTRCCSRRSPPATRSGLGSLSALLSIAEDEDVEFARLAILRLGDLGRSEALPGLISALPREDRRATAIEALARLGNEGAVRVLAPLLEDPDVADETLDALARIGGTSCAQVLADRIDTLATPGEAGPYVIALAAVDGRVGAAALARLLDRDGFAELVIAAARASQARLVPHLIDLARERDAKAAFEALAVLEHLAPIEAVAEVALLLGDRRRRSAAARVLARVDTEESAAALFSASDLDDVRAAFQRCGPRTEAWLRAKLEDPRHQTKRDAVDLLARCGGPDSIPALRALATDRALAPIVVAAIGRIGGPVAVEVLDALSTERRLIAHVVDALGTTGARGAVAVLERIGLAERSQRAPAIEALARIPHADAVTAIFVLDAGRRLRSRTTRALLVMDRDVVTSTLTALLDSEHAPRARLALDAVHRAGGR